MDNKKVEPFNQIIEHQIKLCLEVLINKAQEYVEDHDRLHNFRVAAELQDVSVPQALAGMMAKHTVSVYDLCREYGVQPFDYELWEEKITDHINYLLLLKAAIKEGVKEE